jgi:hypothetical protein
MKRGLWAIAATLWALAALAGDKKATGEFSATASINTASGTRTMAFDVVVSNPRSLADVMPLKKVLEQGGQQALLNAIRGGGQGQIKLGALVYPVDLVAVDKIDDGWRYFIVTARPINVSESDEDGGASLDYPFAVFRFDSTDFSSGDGTIYTRAALSVDDDGHLQIAQYDGDPGQLTNITRVN